MTTRPATRTRPLLVYVPPGYDDERPPLPVGLRDPGLHRPPADVAQPHAFRPPFPETADAVLAAGEAPPCIVVYVDAWSGVRRQLSSSTPPGPVATTPICATISSLRLCPPRTLPGAAHRGDAASRVAGSAQ